MATIRDFEEHRIETFEEEASLRPAVRIVRKSDGATITLAEETGFQVLWDFVHGTPGAETGDREMIAEHEEQAKLDWGSEPYWLPAGSPTAMPVEG